MRRRVTLKCDACGRARELQPVTVTFSPTFDGHPRLSEYVHLCDECRVVTDNYDEMIGPSLRGALCTAIRVMRKGVR